MVCKIHNFSKSASINRDNSLNENLQYLTNEQKLFWNMIGKNKVVQQKSWPNGSNTSDWSKAGNKNLILTTSLKASGLFQIKGRKMARRNHIDQKLTAF